MHPHKFSVDGTAAALYAKPSAAASLVADGMTVASGARLAQFSLRSLLAWYRERLRNQRHRQELATLTDQQLEDIGLSRAVRDIEVSRSFWN